MKFRTTRLFKKIHLFQIDRTTRNITVGISIRHLAKNIDIDVGNINVRETCHLYKTMIKNLPLFIA